MLAEGLLYSEMENQASFFKNKQNKIFFACGILFMLLHLSMLGIIIANSIKEEKSIPVNKHNNFNKLISMMNSLKVENVTSREKDEVSEKANLDITTISEKSDMGNCATRVKFQFLISSMFDAMNLQHFLEMLEIMLQHF